MNSDRSHTEYMRRRRAVVQAVRRAECKTCPEEGPQGPTDKDTQLSRVFGQQAYVYQSPTGLTQNQSCCSGSGTTIRITSCGQVFSITGPGTYTLINTLSNSIAIYENNKQSLTVGASNILPNSQGTFNASPGTGSFMAICTFFLAAGSYITSAPLLAGYNNSQNTYTVTYSGTDYTVPPGETIGPFADSDTYSVA
jgi:hypothetical protein